MTIRIKSNENSKERRKWEWVKQWISLSARTRRNALYQGLFTSKSADVLPTT